MILNTRHKLDFLTPVYLHIRVCFTQVRVAILVEVGQNQRSQSPWTKWIRVNGTTSECKSSAAPLLPFGHYSIVAYEG